ncbi:hypothetical protein [Microbacterium sp.]|uniref:hypothetical protein n=1 Tax=Microbacterium sp. TaxID=51671 RepID=UPI0026319F48|nr:hypothetical protein [Microbacterium sp.]
MPPFWNSPHPVGAASRVTSLVLSLVATANDTHDTPAADATSRGVARMLRRCDRGWRAGFTANLRRRAEQSVATSC